MEFYHNITEAKNDAMRNHPLQEDNAIYVKWGDPTTIKRDTRDIMIYVTTIPSGVGLLLVVLFAALGKY